MAARARKVLAERVLRDQEPRRAGCLYCRLRWPEGPSGGAITTTWELATVQACVIHLIRNTFRFASRKYWDEMSRDLRPVYTASSEAVAARERFAEFDAKWGKQYPAISKLWENAWSEFIPFLDYDVEIRRVICSTNAIESINARYHRAVRARGHFPNDTSALKCLYLVTRALDPTGRGRARWAMR
jgi:putative transposase